MSDDLASLRIQLTNAEENLRLIRERKSEFVQESEIPMQILREERRLLKRIETLHVAMGERPGTKQSGAVVTCSTCGTMMRKQAKYCGQCGAALPAPPPFNVRMFLALGAALVVTIVLVALARSVVPRAAEAREAASAPATLATALINATTEPAAMQFNYYLKSEEFCVQPGDQVTITASGLIDVGTFAGDGGEVGPEGTERGLLGAPMGDAYDLVTGFPHAALMYRVDGEPAWRSYADPTMRTFTAPRAGCLEFQMNDNDPGNNSKTDYWAVSVSIAPKE